MEESAAEKLFQGKDLTFKTFQEKLHRVQISTFSKYDISMIQWITYRQQQMVSVQR